ncbi:TorF family putative porin [Brevundimonas sp.]|uniref:TorF family putative porin n=1 Tax=Brevundimonas sp. TaxID=1871086 RepID=UPI002FC80BA0
MLRTLTTAAAAATALMAFAGNAAAQEAPWPGGTVSFAAGAATDNRSKDVSKSDGEAYVWGGAEWASASGLFYAGTGLETIKSSTGSELEGKIGAGFTPDVAGFDLDLNATFKQQFNADPGADDDAWEFTADVKRSIGPASGRLRLQHSPDGTGSTEAWTWYEARIGWDFTSKLEATASIGRREQDNSVDYTGWNAGFTYALTDNLEAELRYHATDADVPGEQYADALVAGLSIAF